ncbi:glutamine-rich protein 2-like [Danio aesculapii]|uniref:glutamine-rich protein 2-like n=1 Tax=Danio aesculapii TaxID=1142201 RepID=UPI0024BF1F7B|nr:glutamine-rich protein 2-like [Danio aesculapii]
MGRQMSWISIGADRYPETVEALMDLGKLRDRQKSMEAHVGQLQANKADLSQLQHLHDLLTAIEEKQIPDHVPEQLNHLRTLVDSLLADKEKSTGLLSDVQESMLQLQAEFEKLHNTSNRLMEEHSNKQTHIDHLYKIVEELGVKKADKELVEIEIEIKADKQALESKVSCMQFDSMTERLSNMLQELVSKISGQEQDWNKVIEKISTEMDSKLNRIELDPLKKQLDERWRTIHKQLQTPQMPEQEDAAGIRKQLVARFHCISCDRPVEMLTPGQHLMSLPSAPGLPSHKSSRPYTVYELEQVRQHCRSERIPEMADYSYLSRSCGGSHTLTYPSRRYTRLQHITHLIQSHEESRPMSTGPPAQAAEVNILGLNGQVYKGRMNNRGVRLSESRLPNISPREGQWRSREKTSSRGPSQRSSAASPARPHSAMTKASCSASSSSVRDRPTSSMGCLSQDVPLPQRDLGQSEDEPVTSL